MAADPSHKALIILGPDLLARSAAKAKRKGMTRSEYIRQLIEADLDYTAPDATWSAASSGTPGVVASSMTWDGDGQVTIEEAIESEPFVDPA